MKEQYLIFLLERRKFALPLSRVERVFQAVEIVPLPKTPEIVLGLVNLRGSILPVLSLHKRFQVPLKEIEPSDQFVIARTLLVNETIGIQELAEAEVIEPEDIATGIEHITGVIRQSDGMILIQDLDTLLSVREARQLEKAIKIKGGKKRKVDHG